MDNSNSSNTLELILQHTHALTNRNAPFFDSVKDVETEIRKRRKQLLGSHIAVREIVLVGPSLDDDVVNQLSDYLAARTTLHWQIQTEDAELFCFRFYRLMIYALAGGKVRGESIDDILRLAEILVSHPAVFVTAMKIMLPEDMVGELFDFMDTSDKSHITSPTFTTAVLGGLCILLQVLPDPFAANDTEGV